MLYEMSRIMIVAFWSARDETLESCAHQMGKMGEELRSISNSFSDWTRKGPSKKAALEESSQDIFTNESAVKLLSRGRFYSDIPRKIVKDLGYKTYLWNKGRYGVSVSLSVHCGCLGSYTQNSVMFEFFSIEDGAISSDHLIKVLKLLVNIWDVESASVFRHLHSQGYDSEKDGYNFLQLASFIKPDAKEYTFARPIGTPIEFTSKGVLRLNEQVSPLFEVNEGLLPIEKYNLITNYKS